MNRLRHPMLMLLAGALAGFLSGLQQPEVFGIRGALFGFCLSLTAWIVQRRGWKPYAFTPSLLLGITLGFFPIQYMEGPVGEVFHYDYRTLVYAILFIPLYCSAYVPEKLRTRLWRLLIVALIASVARSQIVGWSWGMLIHTFAIFVQGMLPFTLLWIISMQFTDPRFLHKQTEADKDGES